MKDREFIELLNLYVDHEISAEDALRLEREVLSDPKRREVYDQYCRMQKACSILAEELLESAAGQASPSVESSARPRTWGYGPLVAGLAAACAAAVLSVRYFESGPAGAAAPTASADAARASAPLAITGAQVPMKPVFFTRLAPDPTSPGAGRALFTSSDETVRAAELNWIGDIHMTPVYPVGNSDFLLNPRTDLKSAAITGTPDDGDSTLQAEMAAFRFQR
jgi:hypothetical protein